MKTYTHLLTNRHPELVSGSTPPLAQSYRWQTKSNGQIDPLRVFGANKVNFPRPMPVFQLLFARNRALHVAKHLKMHQAIDRIFGSMSGHHIITMLVKPLKQIRGHTDVKRTMRLARKNVNARVFFRLHQRIVTAKWTLKQVQGDGIFVLGVARCCQMPPLHTPLRQLIQRHTYKSRHPELVSGSTGRLILGNMWSRSSQDEFLGAVK